MFPFTFDFYDTIGPTCKNLALIDCKKGAKVIQSNKKQSDIVARIHRSCYAP